MLFPSRIAKPPKTSPAEPDGDLFAAVSAPDFIDVEKNIIALGFFTPSSSRTLTDKKKTISTVRYVNGRKVESVTSILPSAYYGQPITADQDKYFALQKIIQEVRRRTGTVPDPVAFTSADCCETWG